MDEKTIRKLLKEFPFLWAIIQHWVYGSVEIKIETVDDKFINWLVQIPADLDTELWVNYRVLGSNFWANRNGEGTQKITTCEDMSFSQALFRLSADYSPTYLATKKVTPHVIGNLEKIVVYRPPKNKTMSHILLSIIEKQTQVVV